MKPIDQRIINHNPKEGIKGDCLTACIASLFELPYEQVPYFVSHPDKEWKMVFLDFIYEQGYIYEGYAPMSELERFEGVNGYIIVSGLSSKGCMHATIWKNGELVHDPSPNKSGLIEPKGFHMIKKGKKNHITNPWRLFL